MNGISLTPDESRLAIRIGFEEDVLRLIKGFIGRDIEPYEPFDDGNRPWGADDETSGKGLSVKLADTYDDTWHLDVVYGLRAILPAPYRAYFTEDYNYRPSVSVLKVPDPYEIIRVYQTQGWDFAHRYLSTEDLIQTIKEWQRECCLDVIGANYQDIKLVVETLPADLVAFAEKVNFLCWELDQINDFGQYSDAAVENHLIAERLAASLRETRRLYLWWD